LDPKPFRCLRFLLFAPSALIREIRVIRGCSAVATLRGEANFPRNLTPDFGQNTGERPADFAKATTAKEVTEGQN